MANAPTAAIIAPDVMERRKSLVVQDIGRLVESALDAAESAKGEMLDMAASSRRRSLAESLGALLAGIVLALMSAISITRPMARLKHSMAMVAGGDLDAPIHDRERNDEIGVMAQSLELFREQALIVRTLEENERKARELEATQERLRIEDIKKRHASFQLLFVSNPVSMWVHDANTGRIIAVNDAAVKHYGYNREEFLSMSTSDLGSSDTELSELEPTSGDTQWHRKANGAEIEVAIYESFLTYEDCPAALIAAIDLTDRRRAERKILHLAHHDALTDLPNRYAFDAQLASALQSASALSEPIAVLCLDLDGFKEVNDVFGHAVGDKLLKELSYRLSIAADGAFIARMGGDEFTIISTDRSQPAASKALAERLAAVVSEDFDLDGVHVRVGSASAWLYIPTTELDVDKSRRQRRRRALSRESRRLRQACGSSNWRWTDAQGAARVAAGPARRHGAQATHAPLPAAGDHRGRDLRLRGPGAVAPSDPRVHLAGDVHPNRRGERPDRQPWRMGAARSLPRGRIVAEGTAHRDQSVAFAVPARRSPRPGPFRPFRKRARAGRLELEITEGVLMQIYHAAL